jgi:hypothetical protein
MCVCVWYCDSSRQLSLRRWTSPHCWVVSPSCRRALCSDFTILLSVSVCVTSGPLTAVLEAQARTGTAALDFIQTVGMDTNNKAVTVEFKYDTTNPTNGSVTVETMRVPLLTMVPISFMRIDSVSLNYDVKLLRHTVTQAEEGHTILGATLPDTASKYFKASRFDASFSDQGASGASTFSMSVQASQDAMPAGLSKVLSILEDAIIKGTTTA